MRVFFGVAAAVLLAAAAWYIVKAVSMANWDIPGYAWVLMIFGSIIAVGLGVGLMAILFYSSRHGDDEAAQYHQQGNSDRL
jgi:hypothetical protein